MAGMGDVKVAEQAAIVALQKPVLDACQQAWEQEWVAGLKNLNNCSGFIKSVCQILGVPMADDRADGIVDHLAEKWVKLSGPADAKQYAATGQLVLAGLKGSEHARVRNSGHVVVVVDGALYRKIYPRCWGGSTSTAQSKGDQSVGEVWGPNDRDNVRYYRQK